MTKIENLYRYSLILPILIPLVALPIYRFLGHGIPEPFGAILMFVVFSGGIGGIPYLIVASFIFWWTRRKSEDKVRTALLLSPLGMIALYPIILLLMGFYQRPSSNLWNSIGPLAGTWAFLSIFTAIFAYIYVAIVFGAIRFYRGYPYQALPR